MPIRPLSIRHKLTAVILLTSVSVLVLTCLVLFAYEIRSYRQMLERNISTDAEIIATNSPAALIFDDHTLAQEILSGLRAEHNVTVAALFDAHGRLYATYPADLEAAGGLTVTEADGIRWQLRSLTIWRPVMQDRSRVGTLLIRVDLQEMYARFGIYALILLGVLLGASAIAYFLSHYFQRRISAPILDLADTAKTVSEKRDYSVRGIKHADDELGYLTDAFNSMLTQIQASHSALEESEARFRVVSDNVPVLIWMSGTEGELIWFNKAWLAFVGRTMAQELGHGWTENIHPDDLQHCLNTYRDSFDQRKEFRMEYRRRRYDGEYRWLLVHAVPRYHGRGGFAGYIGSCLDIQDLKQAETAVRASEEQLRMITNHASVFLCQTDQDMRYKFANPSYAQRYNLEPEEILGRHISEVIGEAAYEKCVPRLMAALTGQRMEFETELPYLVLGPRWVQVVYVPERTAVGEVVGVITVLADITQRKGAEAAVERARDEAVAASRAKDDFLAALSHELRTPLNPVLLLASEAAENPELSADVRRDFETIRKNVELEARLIDDLLDLTRIVRGKLTLDSAACDLRRILEDAILTVRAEMEEKRIVLVQEFSAGPCLIWGDPVRLQQVFWNVLKNAVKFTPDGGKIIVAVRRTETGDLRVEVTDTGIGLMPHELTRIFDAFSQGDHATKTGPHRFGGLGLGLAISRMIVELHAGVIHATSPGRDQGATFAIELPKLAAGRPLETVSGGSPSPVPPVTLEASTSRGHILLVEDHAPTRGALEKMLERRGYRVSSAGSVAEGKAAAEAGGIDFVISDIGLPDGNGYELMAWLRDRFGLKGIALTGYGMESDIAHSQDAGFVIHLIKPIRVQALDEALTAIFTVPSP